jgi:heme A synthase
METLIELSHRISSGTAFVLTAILVVWAARAYPAGHRVRRGAAVALGFMTAEALIGAGLVLFELVARDASMKRALSMSLHLVNTFFLLATMAVTAWWASGGNPLRLRGQGAVLPLLCVPLGAMLVVGATGAVTALGDTLFPSATLAAGFAQDLAPNAHFLIHLRAIHPMLAVTTAAAIVLATGVVRALRPTPEVRFASRSATTLATVQVGAGLIDVLARAPVWMQLVHLLLADALWIALVLSAAAALQEQPGRAPSSEEATVAA